MVWTIKYLPQRRTILLIISSGIFSEFKEAFKKKFGRDGRLYHGRLKAEDGFERVFTNAPPLAMWAMTRRFACKERVELTFLP
jgi:hypothetical protein